MQILYEIQVPIISTRDKGLNKITVTIDADNEVLKSSENNNSIIKMFSFMKMKQLRHIPIISLL